MRYKCWQSRKDTHLHLMCAEGSEAFEALPVAIRNLGPWTGGPEGEVERLRLPYRVMLAAQGFVVIYAHVSALELETVVAVLGVITENVECPQCQGSGRVLMYHGLRDKECPRCRGRGWIKSKS